MVLDAQGERLTCEKQSCVCEQGAGTGCGRENASLLLASFPMFFKRSDHTVGWHSAWPWGASGFRLVFMAFHVPAMMSLELWGETL